MKKMVTIITLVAIMVGLISAVAQAHYVYIDYVSSSLSISGGRATAGGTVVAFDPNTVKIKVELEYRSSSNSNWAVYNSNVYSDTKSNVTRLTGSGSCSISSGYQYRAKVTGTVNGENAIAYSSVVSY